MDKRIIDLTGQRFGRWVVLSFAYSEGHAFWNCVCDCGTKKVVMSGLLRCGRSQSCGCSRDDKKYTIEFVSSTFEKIGYTLLSTEYVNAKTKLEYICPEGHKHSMSWNNWQRGKRCPAYL